MYNIAIAFLLTRLMRGVTKDVGVDKAEIKFLLTRLMRGVTTTSPTLKLVLIISTHTPHARRDKDVVAATAWKYISTHTPHARRDPQRYNISLYA